MKSAIAILTYRRLHALNAMMLGIEQHCPQYQTAIFEDCGQRDATSVYLTQGRHPAKCPELMATQWFPVADDGSGTHYPNAKVFMGDQNLGVTGNSNRALAWFMNGDWDHLLLCNDDLFVNGDFAKFYGQAHADLGIGMFCFCDFTQASPAISGTPESYKWTTYRARGYGIKFLPRFTGIMMSITRELVEKVGYFDAEFGKFGEEHCDYTIRCRMAGGIRYDNQDMNCLDVEHDFLKHQDVETSMKGAARKQADEEARQVMARAAHEYRYRHFYRPFRLTYPIRGGGYFGGGTSCRQLEQVGYKLVTDRCS